MHSVLRRTPTRIAWLLPAGTLFFMCGILLGRIISTIISALIILTLALMAALAGRKQLRTAALLMAILALGAALGWRTYHPSLPAEGDYTVRGTVAQTVAWEHDGQVQTILADVTLNGTPAPDAYWTYYLDEDEVPPEWLVPGAQLEMIASVYHPGGQDNPGGFDFKEYLLQRGIRIGLFGNSQLQERAGGFSLRGWAAALRHNLALHLMDAMGEKSGAYAAAMLLGTRDFIPEDERAAFQELGIAHILSISGFHVGVLIGLLMLLLKPLPLPQGGRLLFEAAILGAYCLISGGNAPVLRAAVLLLWREYTQLRHQQILPLHMLAAAALTQLVLNPALLTSPSFQLTYGAMLGLVMIRPRLTRLRACRTLHGKKLWEAFCAALAAQLGILFPQLYWFGELPLASILLNMALIPLFAGLIALYWTVLISLPIPGLRELLGTISAAATELTLAAVHWLASLDLASIWTRQADLFTFAGWVLLIFASSSFVPRQTARHRGKLLFLGGLLVALIFLPQPENTVTYTQFSVGSADAAVLQDRNVTVVIDAGEDGQAVASHLHQRRQSVEALIITHLHTDHGGGIRALIDEGIPVEVCHLPWAAETPIIDEEVLPLVEELRLTGTEIRYLHRGDVIELPSGQLTVLWPEKGRVFPQHDANDVNLVLQADIAGVTMLLTSDLPGVYEKYVSVPADILKVAHHGSKTSTTADFLAEANPQILLQSNSDETRELRMAEVAGDTPLYSTEKHGGITITFLGDGRFTVETVK